MKRLILLFFCIVLILVLYSQLPSRPLFFNGASESRAGSWHVDLSSRRLTRLKSKDEKIVPLNNSADSSVGSRRPNPYPIPKRIDLGHIEGKGIGYENGYTKLSVIFAPEYQVGRSLSMLDLRGVIFDDGTFAANAGIITRFLPQSFCEIFGLNLFYDFRQGRHGNFNQISGGFEVLNKRWEVHANASVPVGQRKHFKKCVFDHYEGPYREVCKRFEVAEYAVDGNVGYYFVNSKNFQLYAAAGPYYLTGPLNTSAVGGKAVLRPQFGDIASVELSVSHDRLFETIYQVNVVLTLPLYKFSSALKNKRGPCGMSTRQVYQPIDRDIILYKKRCCHNNF